MIRCKTGEGEGVEVLGAEVEVRARGLEEGDCGLVVVFGGEIGVGD